MCSCPPTRGQLINQRAEFGSRLVALRDLIPALEKLSRKTPPKHLADEWARVRAAKEQLASRQGELAATSLAYRLTRYLEQTIFVAHADIESDTDRVPNVLKLRGPLRELSERLGGIAKLAAEIGVDERSVRRWSALVVLPPKPTRLALAALARAHGIEPPFAVTDVCSRPAWADDPIPEENEED